MTIKYNHLAGDGKCGQCGKPAGDVSVGCCKKCLLLNHMRDAAADYGTFSSQFRAAKAKYDACK